MLSELRDRLPERESLPDIPDRPSLPSLSPLTVLYLKMFVVALLMIIGLSGLISGLIIVTIMALSTNITGIIYSSLAISFGAGLLIGGYIWFTT